MPPRRLAPTSFAPLAGQAGCLLSIGAFAGDEHPQGCGSAPALAAPRAVAVTPDGRQVVFAGGGDATSGTNGVSVFARDAASGALRFSSCVTDNGGDGRVGSSGICTDGDALATATGLAFSPDATAVYVSASRSSAVSWFSRDAETGALTQKGCIKQLVRARERCGAGYALAGASAVAAHPEGDHVFVAASRSGAIAVFARNRDTGALTERSCVSDTASDGACARVSGVAGVDRLALCPTAGTCTPPRAPPERS